MAQYVSLDHVATLNGALGLPLALARAAAPLALGWMWTPQVGYGHGLWLLLITAAVGVAALFRAQQHSPLRSRAEIAAKYPDQSALHPAHPKELE
jgi:hypothetical protein